MSRKLSKYPGAVPKASSINYDEASAGEATNFQVVATYLAEDTAVTFVLGDSVVEAKVGSVAGPDKNEDFLLEGSVTFPKTTIYQLILQNLNVPKHVQPCWIYVE